MTTNDKKGKLIRFPRRGVHRRALPKHAPETLDVGQQAETGTAMDPTLRLTHRTASIFADPQIQALVTAWHQLDATLLVPQKGLGGELDRELGTLIDRFVALCYQVKQIPEPVQLHANWSTQCICCGFITSPKWDKGVPVYQPAVHDPSCAWALAQRLILPGS